MFLKFSENFDPKIFAENLRRYRKKLKLTQQQVGDLIGLSLNSYYRWEQGLNQNYGSDKIDKLCMLFNCDIKDLITKHSEVNDSGIKESQTQPGIDTAVFWVKNIKLFKSTDLSNVSDIANCKNSLVYALPEISLKEQNDFFAFEVPSSTMESYRSRQTIPIHSTVLCSTKFAVNSLNEVPVVYKIDDNPAGIREYNFIDNDTVSLRAWNEQYPPLTIERSRVTVFGVVKKVIIDF